MKAFSSVAHLGRSVVAVTACGLSTAAVPQTSPIKFAVFGDIGNTAGSAAVANLTRSQAAQFILMVGDLCYDIPPLATQIGANYATEKAAGKLYPALGNHEYNDPCGGVKASNYFSYFTLPNNERYYDFVKGPVHFFALNSHLDPDGVRANSKQGRWLKQKLAASTSPWQVVFFHHPPYSSGKHQSSTFMRWPFEAWGVDAVFNGHDHDYERVLQDADRNGVKLPYFVSGLGGQSRRSFGAIVAGSVKRYAGGDGALFVTASSTSLSFAFRNTAGALIDSYTVSKSGTAPSTTEFDFQTVPAE